MTDVWNDEPAEELANDTKVHLDHLYQDGFRTGVAVGQEEQVQPGFDAGYEAGAKEGFSWGACHGILDTYEALRSKIEDAEAVQKLDLAVARMWQISEKDAYVSSYNACVDVKTAELGGANESTLIPEKLDSGEGAAGNKMQEVKDLLKETIP